MDKEKINETKSELKGKVRRVLSSPGTHFFLSNIIRAGFKLDIVDVINDLEYAVEIFTAIHNDVIKRFPI